MNQDTSQLSLLRELAESDRPRLVFPEPLEEAYRARHHAETLDYYRRFGLWVALLAVALVVLGALTQPLQELAEGFRDPLGYQGGMPVAAGIMLVCMFTLPLLARSRLLEPLFEAWFVVLTGTALACVLTALLLVRTPWMQHLWVLGVMYGYIMLHALSRQRLLVNFAAVILSFVLTAVAARALGLDPDPRLAAVTALGINFLGGLLSYLNEARERQHYLRATLAGLEQQRLHQLSDQVAEENRLKERVNAVHEVMSGEDDPLRLASGIIRHLVPEVGAQVAVLYYMEGGELIRLAAAGLDDDRRTHTNRLTPGETLVGQCALDGRSLRIDEAPPGYLSIRSAIGECEQPALLLLPLVHSERTCGVIEFASLRPLKEADQRFLQAVAPSLATALTSVHARRQARAQQVATEA